MELFRSEQYYIFVRNESSLWWNRFSGAFSVRSAWDLSDIEDIECLGITEGIIGKVEHSNVFESRLMIIKESTPIGQLYFHHTIHKIKSICLLNMGAVNQELDLPICTKHGSANVSKGSGKKIGARLFENSAFLNKTVGAVKNVSNTIKTTTQQAATQVKQTVRKQRDPKDAERFEKRLVEELHKIFDDSDSFYYSRTLDLTNSLQRQYETEVTLNKEDPAKAVTDITRWWRHVDDRFFWNKHMLKDIIALESPNCDQWLLPIIQGYIQLAQIPVEPMDSNPLNTESLSSTSTCDETFTLGLISRRSRYQAGTRYNRRGAESDGRVANYVETEQIVSIICSDSIHRASFVQVRGSVPIFWSQPDYKFRPPPRLDRTEEESQAAFKNHFDRELSMYKQVCIVNLVERQGRERVIWDAYSNHILKYNHADVTYATFDFHEYCRGMHYENVSILINALSEIITEMRFCWRDERGLICGQNGVFRVNCIDCLDRTNVVQTAIAKFVLELQLCRLGLGTPGSGLPASLRNAFLTLWADNGDVISRQYAGTKALKGDYTRTGERKLTGMMKDGVASANRYYLSTFKDALRQMAIDVMTGESRSIPTTLIDDSHQLKEDTVDTAAMAQHVKQLIDDCKKLLIDNEPVLGAWGLIDADPYTGDPQESDVDTVLLLTQHAIHVAEYDDTSDRVTSARQVMLRDLTAIHLGPTDTPNTNIFALGRKPSPEVTHCIRISYQHRGEDGYFFMFRSTALRFFNNIVAMRSPHVTLSQNIFALGRKPSPEVTHCIRISYQHRGEDGYFFMFRSTALRFFNNIALALSSKEEMIESLHSICESIMVARDVAKLPSIPFYDGAKIDKRKSKVIPSEKQAGAGRSLLYLDISTLPTLTKNVGETQLVSDLRSAGSKALNNMSEQFSRFNRFSARARPSLQLKFDQSASRTKKMFTLSGSGRGDVLRKKGSLSDGMSSDYSSDDDNRTNIFEPTLDNFEHTQVYIGKGVQQKTEPDNDCDLVENPLYSSKIESNEPQNDDVTPQTSQITYQDYDTSKNLKTPVNCNKKNPFDETDSANIAKQKSLDTTTNMSAHAANIEGKTPEVTTNIAESKTPEIQIHSVMTSNNYNPKLSHSSSDINLENLTSETGFHIRSSSQHDVTLNIQQSHSESALKGLGQLRGLTSPASAAKEMFSPLSKIAKGVQSFGANLDPRKMKGPVAVKAITEQQYEEHRKFQEKWRDCNTRLVAL